MRIISPGFAGFESVLLRETLQPLLLARADRAGSAATDAEKAIPVAAAKVKRILEI